MMTDKYERLIRKGSLLNALGVLRCAILSDGHIEYKDYANLIRRNFMDKDGNDVDLTRSILSVWGDAIVRLSDMGFIDVYKSNMNEIYVKIENKGGNQIGCV